MAQFDPVPDHLKKSKFRNLTEPERQVARRLAQFRRWKGLSQAVLAKQVGMTRSKIANIEKERVTLRFADVAKIAEALRASVAWLAEGIGPPTYFTPLDSEIVQTIPASTEFLKGYAQGIQKMLQSKFHEREARLGTQFFKPLSDVNKLQLKLTARGVSIENAMANLPAQIESLISLCPSELHPDLYLALNNTIRDFTMAREQELRQAAVSNSNSDENFNISALDSVYESVNSGDVKAQWPLLKKRLQRATEPVGSKSKLAEFLGVKLASVSQWLSEKEKSQREPGAETTLRMLKWVELQERKT